MTTPDPSQWYSLSALLDHFAREARPEPEDLPPSQLIQEIDRSLREVATIVRDDVEERKHREEVARQSSTGHFAWVVLANLMQPVLHLLSAWVFVAIYDTILLDRFAQTWPLPEAPPVVMVAGFLFLAWALSVWAGVTLKNPRYPEAPGTWDPVIDQYPFPLRCFLPYVALLVITVVAACVEMGFRLYEWGVTLF